MQLTREIDVRTTGLATAIDERALMLSDRIPVPLDALVRRVGAVNAEAVRQSGRLTITVVDAAGDLATVAWGGVSGVVGSVEREGGRAARRVAKATDTAAASTMEKGANRPSGPYESWTKGELYERAQELDIDGRSGMSKSQLVKALRSA